MAGLLRGIGKAFSNLIPSSETDTHPVRQASNLPTPTSSFHVPSEDSRGRVLPRAGPPRQTVSSISGSRASSDSEEPEPVRGYGPTSVPVRDNLLPPPCVCVCEREREREGERERESERK
jgi:hypothetical protein